LEKQLKVPELERCMCEGELKKANEMFVEAVRVWHHAENIKSDAFGRAVEGGKRKENVRQVMTPLKSGPHEYTPKSAKVTTSENSPLARNNRTEV
jgi:hypothetical protein